MKAPKVLRFVFSDLQGIYESIYANKALSVNQYMCLLHISIYKLLNAPLSCKAVKNASFEPKVEDSTTVAKSSVLLKAVYYMDATADLDDSGTVPFLLNGVYKEQILHLLTCLLQNKPFVVKKVRGNNSFLESAYHSILSKLSLDVVNLSDKGYLLDYLQKVTSEETESHKDTVGKFYPVMNFRKITGASLYSKYDNFDKDDCSNYRFMITESTSLKYPEGSFIFGVVTSNNKEVVLYTDAECTMKLEDE